MPNPTDMPRLVEARLIEDFRVFLRFNDGIEGTLNFREFLPAKGIFAPLHNPDAFAQIYVDPETCTVAWPNGASFDTLILHSRVTGEPIVIRGETVFVPPARATA